MQSIMCRIHSWNQDCSIKICVCVFCWIVPNSIPEVSTNQYIRNLCKYLSFCNFTNRLHCQNFGSWEFFLANFLGENLYHLQFKCIFLILSLTEFLICLRVILNFCFISVYLFLSPKHLSLIVVNLLFSRSTLHIRKINIFDNNISKNYIFSLSVVS